MIPIEHWNVRELFDSISDAVYTLDSQWRITYANRQAHEFFGRAPGELEGLSFWDLFGALRDTPFVRTVERIMRDGGVARVDGESRVRPGRWIELRAYAFAHGVAVYLHDATDHHRAEERARETLEQLELIIDSVPALVAYVDRDHRYRFNNHAYQEWFGIEPGEATGRHVREVIGEPAYQRLRPILDRALAGERVGYDTEVPFAGGTRHAKATYVPDRGPDGEVRGLVGIVIDVTDQRQSEKLTEEYNRRIARMLEELSESEERYRTFIEQSSEGIWRFEFSEPIDVTLEPDELIDRIYASGYLAECNDAFARMYGYGSASEIVGMRITDFLIREDPTNIAYLRAAIASNFRLSDAESVERDRDGVIHYYLNNLLGIVQQGCLTRVWGTQRDITEQRRIEEEREQLFRAERAARSEAETANRVKDEFLSTLSHELRTPLNAILGWSQLLCSDDDLDPGVRQGLEVIERNARSQTRIVEDLLDMSRIVTGKVRLEVQRLDPATVIEAALETVAPAAEAKGLRLHSILSRDAGSILGDPSRLQQVVWNLLSNAVKFTPSGGTVTVQLERRDGEIEITVADTGAGIRPEFLPHIFERFRQADSSTTRSHGGLGLGLAIVKQLVELHGGTVRARSAGAGEGSTFTVTLPVGAEPEAPAHESVAAREATSTHTEIDPALLSGVRILVVDDEPDARELVTRIFLEGDAVVETAASAAEAIERMRSMRPDVLISDIGMPGEDGYALIAKVRALEAGEGGSTPAIALTAFARSEDRRRAIMAGYQMHIAKPVEPSELIAVVASLTGRLGEERSPDR